MKGRNVPNRGRPCDPMVPAGDTVGAPGDRKIVGPSPGSRRSKDRPRWAYVALLAAVVGVHLVFLRAQGHGVPLGDIHDLLKGPELFVDSGGAPTLAQVLETHEACDDYPPPLMALGQLAFLRAGGGLRTLPLLNLLYLLAFAWAFWEIGHRLFDGATTLLAAMLLFSQNTFLYMSLAVGPELLLLLLYSGLLLALLHARELTRRAPLLLATLALGLMSLTKVSFFLFAPWPVLFLLAWVRVAGPGPFPWRRALLLCGGAVVLVLPWYLHMGSGVLCYLSGNLVAEQAPLPDFLFADLLPRGPAAVVHALALPSLAGVAVLAHLGRQLAAARGMEERDRNNLFSLSFCCTAFLPGLILVLAASLLRGKLELLELGVSLPFALLLAARLLLASGSRPVRCLVWGMGSALLLFNLLTFIPPARLARALGGHLAGGPGTAMTPVDLHEEVARTLLRSRRPGEGEVAIVAADPRVPPVLLDPVNFWYAAASLGQELRFHCAGCREGRYETRYEQAARRRIPLEYGPVRGQVPPTARLALVVGPYRPGSLLLGGAPQAQQVLARLALALDGGARQGGAKVPLTLVRLNALR